MACISWLGSDAPHSQREGPEVETDGDVMRGVEEQRGDEGVEGTMDRQVGPQRLSLKPASPGCGDHTVSDTTWHRGS